MVEASAWTLYDTPDHRLWQADLALVHRGHILALHRRSQLSFGKAEASQACRGAPPPRLLAQWPSSDLKTALLPLVRIRAIRAVLACTVERHTAILRDDLDKTVARVEAWLVQPDPASCRLWVTVEDLRGYERERVAAAVALVGRGWYEAEDDPFALFATEILDIGQPVESGFPDGHKPAGQALRACLRQALQSLPDLEKGVVDDIDTEFLHQYRVILRRARSLVAQFRSVFPSKRAERIRAILGGWARCSNSQRDLDVWLLARSEHEALVPEQLRPGMEGLFRAIARDRAAVQRELAARLVSSAHRSEREELLALLDLQDDGPDAALPLTELARRRTWKTFRRAANQASLVNAATSSDAVHDVRIRCKKLRYMLDACGRFTAPDDHQKLRNQLKAVQAVLGEFNDACLQCRALLSRAESHRGDPATLLVLGALVGALDRNRASLHDQLLLGLGDLASPGTWSTYRSLFRTKD